MHRQLISKSIESYLNMSSHLTEVHISLPKKSAHLWQIQMEYHDASAYLHDNSYSSPRQLQFSRTCSQLFFDKVYRDKMASDLRGACVLCTEESVREALRRAIGANWAYNSLSPWREAGCAAQICREQICHERSLGIFPHWETRGGEWLRVRDRWEWHRERRVVKRECW